MLPKVRVRGHGFTLIEIMVVLVIFAILVVLLMTLFPKQLSKARDARRKSDLVKLKQTMDDYYNDKECYPVGIGPILCRQSFQKYGDFPCDPFNKNGYEYYYQVAPDCRWYKIFARLENDDDPDIVAVGCSPSGCSGTTPDNGTSNAFDWGVTSPNVSLPSCENGWTQYGCQGPICNVVDPGVYGGTIYCKISGTCVGEACCNHTCK